MTEEKFPRADKFLWSVRLYKTRSLSGEACSKGKVTMNGSPVKPSRPVKENDILEIKKPPVTYTYKVIALPKNRIPAKQVSDYIVNLTTPEELKKLEKMDSFFIRRDRGSGRPTKKERRLLDNASDC